MSAGNDAQPFADAVGRYLGLPYVLPVNRGRTAIELALVALELKPGDEVVVPSYVCRSVPDAVLRAGLTPAFADVGPDLSLTPESVWAAVTPRTRAVVVPHLFGHAAPIDHIEAALRGTGIAVIDDAAQSLGARCGGRLVGSFGACGIVSCGPGKALAGSGGGALVTRDRSLYERARRASLGRESGLAIARRILSFWVWRRFRRHTLPLQLILERMYRHGAEGPADQASRIANVEAAIARQQLRTLERRLTARRRNAERLLAVLGDLGRWSVSDLSPDGAVVKLVLVLPAGGPEAQDLIEHLAVAGVECQGGYVPAHEVVSGTVARVAQTDRLWRRVLCIPLETALRQPQAVVQALGSALMAGATGPVLSSRIPAATGRA